MTIDIKKETNVYLKANHFSFICNKSMSNVNKSICNYKVLQSITVDQQKQ